MVGCLIFCVVCCFFYEGLTQTSCYGLGMVDLGGSY